MSKILGKRKAREENYEADLLDAQEIFRRHFEAQFKPLAVAPLRRPPPTVEAEDDEDPGSEAEDSEWEGISGDEEDDGVEVVDHATSQKPIASMSKSELKKFMSSRIPTTETTPTPATGKPPRGTDQDEDAPSLLANDLALQRLLSESSLLSRAQPNPMFYPSNPSSSGGAAAPHDHPASRAFAAGKLRLAQTDMRLRALGSKESLLAQKKMPMGMRRGINAAVRGREEKRRREAKENGIVLEREVVVKERRKGTGGGMGKGDVDAPGVGRLRGAQLTLSKRDIASIENSRGRGSTGGRGGRSGSRGGGGGGGGRGKKRR
ncbi:hypothetical protein GE09DRAFT_1283559 [Coniochaeta sp. 2T2.1]|nr:hypothetical protein GE09DRAFT_1283559 [Coniochaeta sp. 2T2.1]